MSLDSEIENLASTFYDDDSFDAGCDEEHI